ncbi:hypothetical protein AVEN_106146-1 [Araneus ventricosus]|uniref:Peptidase aspartic putative domain-containing protein n=1 Tax=Araneus ventricosus TaxID=182803 RepID=A0A4Y2TAA1_ARAVE|nr:hypothetical protein AVEN_106146-1 [Araneus ventricosus]
MIIDAHMSQLLNLNPVRKSQDVKSLRRLYSICEAHIRGLENNGVDPNSYSSLLYPVLLKSIPRDLSLEFSHKINAKKENISDLLEFLIIEIQCRERNEHLIKEFDADAQKETRLNSYDKPTHKYGKFNKSKVDLSNRKNETSANTPHASAFVIDVKKCLFCVKFKSDHDTLSCPLSVEERKAYLRRNGTCYLCLIQGHVYKKCNSKRPPCGKCHRIHSELICDTSTALEPLSSGGEQSKVQNTSEVVTCSNINMYQDEVLLESCSTLMTIGNKRKTINILLDNASQRCFLKKEIADEMKLPVIRREKLLVYVFGSRDPIETSGSGLP